MGVGVAVGRTVGAGVEVGEGVSIGTDWMVALTPGEIVVRMPVVGAEVLVGSMVGGSDGDIVGCSTDVGIWGAFSVDASPPSQAAATIITDRELATNKVPQNLFRNTNAANRSRHKSSTAARGIG